MSSLSDATARGFKPGQVAQIWEEVDKIAGTSDFSNSQRKTRLLRYLVKAALEGRGREVDAYAIALDVFERPASFDPRTESTVRAEVSRFRSRLKDYYAQEGSADLVVI